MYPNIRLHCLVLALTLLPLAGVTTPSLAVFKSAVTFGRTDKINLRKTRAESIGAATVQKVSQQSSGTKQPSAADVAWNEGMELYRQGTVESLKAAIEKFEEAAKLYSTSGYRGNEAFALNKIGLVYSDLGDKQKALSYLNQALPLRRSVGDRRGEAVTLNNIGLVYSNLGDKQKALTYYNQALPLLRVVGDRSSEADTLNNIGSVYDALGDKRKALDYYNQALPLRKIVGDRSSEAVTLNNIGAAYYALGEKQKALSYFNQVLLLFRAVGDRKREAVALNNIGRIYDALGEKRKALSYFSQSLPLSRVVGSRSSEAITLNNIGGVYYDLGEKQKALSYFNQSLPLRRAVGDRDGEAATLNNIGKVYNALEKKQKALIYYNQALPLSRAIGDRDGEATTLNNIGEVYNALGEKQKALIYYNQALSLLRAVGNRDVEAITLSNISYLLTAQKQPTLAIFFYKQSVNITESLRNEIRGLPKDIQQTYAQTVAKTYRNLADLLLQQNRILEAQQVLELLKVQEINSIDKDIRATLTPKGIEYTPAEAQIKSQHENLVALGEKLLNCETKSKCSDAQKQQWQSQRETLKDEFENTVAKAEQNAKDRITQIAQIGKDDFIKSYQALVEAQPGTLLVYPFVTENKLWLLWASAGGVLGSTKVPTVGREKLLKAVQEFRDRLQKPTSNPAELAQLQQSGQQLYEWLIKPLEPALASKSIKHLIFSLDSATRYIPMGALVAPDKKYLIERYTISTVLYATSTDTSERLPKSTQVTSVLGLGVSQSFPPEFKALKNVEPELNAIIKGTNDATGLYPGEKFLNEGFSEQTLADYLNGQTILHIATHAKFLSTNPKESFLLLGNGQKYPIREIQYLRNLGKVHLVVLSACETGLGENDTDGKEILGISAYFTGGPSKAKAVLASLWKVNDISTSELMKLFYQNLAKGTMTKSEALRQAQLSIVKNASAYNHPYYWAPFILIGNGF